MKQTIALAFALAPVQAQEDRAVIATANARFTVIAAECIRLEYSADGTFIDDPSRFAVNRQARFLDFKLERTGERVIIDTGAIRLVYTPDGKAFSAANLRADIRRGDKTVEWTPGRRNPSNLGGTIRTLDSIKQAVDLGEGLLSRDGWYLLDDSKGHLLIDDWVRSRPAKAGTDWYLFGYGLDFKAALRALTAIAGPVPMPRKYALGSWYSRWWPYSSTDYRKIVAEYARHDFPLDIMVLDMDWHKDGWTGWSWNRELLPDAEALLAWFHQQRLFATLNVHPADGVGPHEDAYKAFMRDLGKDPSRGDTVPFDAGDKRYLDTLFKHTHAPLENAGVDFWWLDWQQYPFTRSVPDLTNLAWLNRCYFTHTGRDGRRGMSFSRWAGWGDHRYVIHFSGDADTGWPMLQFEVPFTSTAGNVGCFFWSHDIGGHQGSRNEESFVRWTQFGALSAALRIHSTRSSELDRRPWTYGRQATDAMRVAFQLRSILFPYIYSSVRESHRDSLPLIRPLYLEHPQDEKAYRNGQEYMFGGAFLVAPVASPGVGPSKLATQAVWFPKGRWFNWFTGESYEGDLETFVTANLDEFPLFVKGGVPIPTQPYTPRMTTESLTRLIVRCYPGDAGGFMLYEDDGVSTEYLGGRHAVTPLFYRREGGTVKIVIGPTNGTYTGRVERRSYVLELPCTRRARSATLDGRPTNVDYDETALTNRIAVPERPVGEQVVVELDVEEADAAALREAAAARRLRRLGGEGGTIEQLLANPKLTEGALALSGIAMLQRRETPYFHGGPEMIYVYNTRGVATDVAVSVIDQMGEETRSVVEERTTPTPAKPLKSELPPFPSSAAVPVGAPLTRVLRLDATVNGRHISSSRVLQSNVIKRQEKFLRFWNVVGPFPFQRDAELARQVCAPERSVVDLAATYADADGLTVGWKKAEVDANGLIDLRQPFNRNESLAYAITYLFSDEAQAVTFHLNSDDGIEAWLNGRKIHSNHTLRPVDHSPDVVKGTLKEGVNTLLLKVSNGDGGWSFKAAVEASKPLKEAFTDRP
ncbi:MAG: DUF5110 domain-containing protein [Planctomycetes bacterium]|nr:DUF5110 domain-containing protein [Planctomycetota bacterium]